MKFDFPFEKLLDHKRTLENEAVRYFNEAQSKLDEANVSLNTMFELVDHSRQRAGQLNQTGGAQLPELGMLSEFITGQKLRVERQRLTIRELSVEAERRQELVILAARERKALEKLREKRLEEFKKLRKKREEKEMDELVVTRFKRSEFP